MANVATIHPKISPQLTLYNFINDLSEGYDGVIRGAEKYLPKQLSEESDDRVYNARLKLATYLDSFNPIIDGINGLVFQQPIKIENEDQDLQAFLKNSTVDGKNFNSFIKKYFKSALKKGRSYAYVDIPQGAGQYATDVQRREAGMKPFVTFLRPEQIINFRTKIQNGKEVITMVVIEEVIEVENAENEFAVDYETQYRVLRIGSVSVYNEQGEMVGQEISTGLSYIPLVELNLDEDGCLFDAKPPFLDVGRLGIDNYQMFSDCRWSANTACIPFLVFTGWQDEEAKNTVVGPNTGKTTSNDKANLKYLDYEGKGIKLSLELIDKLEKNINQIGLSIVTSDRTQITATEKTIDSIQTQSKLQNWVDSLKMAIRQILKYAMDYENKKFDGEIEIKADIIQNALSPQEMLAYIKLAESRKLSTATLLKLLVSRGALFEDLDVDNELDEIESEDTAFREMVIEE